MSVKTKSGRVLKNADVDRLVSKADAGFDLSNWKPRRGRPALDATATEHAPRITVRVPQALHDRVIDQAKREGRPVSHVVRVLLMGYTSKGTSGVRAAKTASSAHAGRSPRVTPTTTTAESSSTQTRSKRK